MHGGGLKGGFSMTNLEQMLKRQAQWQTSRRFLTWPEKIRMAERIRESLRLWRAQPHPTTPGPRKP